MRAKLPPELELETFCHGAMCVSYSGRCLLSNYMTGRDSNRGACAQPCRYQYALMEEKRPGEYFPVFEDEKGTYIMNSRDMCMIDHLDDIMDAGIDCIKIEGRAKSEYYAAIVTGAYRHVLDEVAVGEMPDPVWLDEVEHVSHRHYSTGFYYGQPGQYYDNSRYIRDWQVVAVVESCDANGMATLSLRNKFRAGDTVEVVGPDCKPFSMVVPEMRDAEGFTLLEPRNPRMIFTMQLPRSVPAMSFVRHAVDLSRYRTIAAFFYGMRQARCFFCAIRPGRMAMPEPTRKQTMPRSIFAVISSRRKRNAKSGAIIGLRKKMRDASCALVFSSAIMWQT